MTRRKSIKSRILSSFILIAFLNSIMFPTALFALTSGPSSPEFSSFEPVDVTDMVDLKTGDFTYSIPLLDVPGPEGGYPLSLSYHAGIRPEQESSWVGLGWTLNPGAINRFVNVFADDFNGSMEAVRDEWAGGSTRSYSVGVGYAGANVGITVANDSYRGIGIGHSVGVGVPLGGADGYGVGASVGLTSSPYGGTYGNAGIFLGTTGDGARAAVSVGVSYDFENNSATSYAGVGVSYNQGINNISLVGASISSEENSSISSSIAGIKLSAVNDKIGQLSSLTNSYSLMVPVWNTGATVNLGTSYTRYFLNQAEAALAYGTLYPNHQVNIMNSGGKSVFDCYTLPDPESTNGMLSNPNLEMGGSLPAYDLYTVSGQGIGGVISPYILDFGSLYRRSENYDESDVTKELLFDMAMQGYHNYPHKTQFRFVNDFSNSFYRSENFVDGSSLTSVINQGNNAYTGVSGTQITGNQSELDPFYNNSTGKLVGSKSIEWYSIGQINSGTATGLLIPDDGVENSFVVDGISRDLSSQIGGFKVTNSSGVTYHYSQPVYNFREFSKSNNPKLNSSRSTEVLQPYAYTWLLTAITGPDFVDRNNIGSVDDEDWGYWVKFDYGKWTDQYLWRNPVSGTHKDLDSEVENYSSGQKELYYLDAIRTRSHTALFVKDLKHDGKGVKSSENGDFGLDFNPSTGLLKSVSAATLGLSKILLFTNSQLDEAINDLSSGTFTYNDLRSISGDLQHIAPLEGGAKELHQGRNVIDVFDVNFLGAESFSKYCIREIEFMTDYTLSDNTPNTVFTHYSNLPYNKSSYIPPPTQSADGKYTLKGVRFKSSGGRNIMPATTFTYYNDYPYDKDKIDIWGYYKSDALSGFIDLDKIPKYTTYISKNSVRNWSLASVNTALGSSIHIDYESDSYETAAIEAKANYAVQSIIKVSGTTNQVSVQLYSENNLQSIPEFTPGRNIRINSLFRHKSSISDDVVCEGYTWFESEDPSSQIVSTSASAIVITSPTLYNALSEVSVEELYYNTDINQCDFAGSVKVFPMLVCGNVEFIRNETKLGGGLRVSSVKLRSEGVEYSTNYNYSDGVTSYEPLDVNIIANRVGTYSSPELTEIEKQETAAIQGYKNNFFRDAATISSLGRVLPPPGVVYETVTVTDQVRRIVTGEIFQVPGKAVYEFLTLKDINSLKSSSLITTSEGRLTRVVKLKDFTSKVGTLKSVKYYDVNNLLMSDVTNSFLFEESSADLNLEKAIHLSKYKNQGRLDEMYFEGREVFGNKQLMITKIENYPLVLLRQESQDHRTKVDNELSYLGFDFLSGEPSAVHTKDGFNNEFITYSKAAYHYYPEMGTHSVETGRKNMLTQNALVESYKVIPNTSSPYNYIKVGLVEANATTWSKVLPEYLNGSNVSTGSNVWRKDASYIWSDSDVSSVQEDGTSVVSSYFSFDFLNYSNNSNKWVGVGKINATDVYSHPLVTTDINNISSVAIYSPYNNYLLASVANASFGEVAYSGAEFMEGNGFNEGNVYRGQGAPVNAFAHTGKNSLLVEPGEVGFTFVIKPNPNEKYLASVWVYLPGEAQSSSDLDNIALIAKKNGTIINSAGRKIGQTAGNWHRIEMEIDPAGSSTPITVNCKNVTAVRAVYFDDFRVHPKKSNIACYVYNQKNTQLTHVLNNDNFYRRFEYDNNGELAATYEEFYNPVERIVNRQIRNYGNME